MRGLANRKRHDRVARRLCSHRRPPATPTSVREAGAIGVAGVAPCGLRVVRQRFTRSLKAGALLSSRNPLFCTYAERDFRAVPEAACLVADPGSCKFEAPPTKSDFG